jgi:hypothetical protein
MAQRWDWRQSYARYSDTEEGQDPQKSAPRGPQAPTPDQQLSTAPSGAPQGYVQPPGSGLRYYAAYPLRATSQGCRGLSIAAFVCGGLALLLVPFILGPLGITFGFVGQSRGDRLGKWAALMSVTTMLLGIAFRMWMARNMGVDFGD